ncbi:PQQ-binding-like beta-propeller repeat protein [Caldisalinibacter kiritimatiensis]|uniref:Pyrrolo-quinoline quinone repeat domain-containing protein n=1 Tax=Caldisalinibacter kiritimatiensis TaxID=1304284 RepID=R1CT58_9FIRM|nr:PQQ-binding-like beta-propeller repeat protein [Caldisalinibacter kiritimatiensis]EOD01831.1 hypothetical protein L21TH_0078 [Caldisalinibacter kiritimatiensis]
MRGLKVRIFHVTVATYLTFAVLTGIRIPVRNINDNIHYANIDYPVNEIMKIKLTKYKDIADSVKTTKELKINYNQIDKETLNKIEYSTLKYEEFPTDEKIEFKIPKEYSKVKGVTCFRGNNYRNTASYGTADIKEKRLEIVWDIGIGSIDRWTGVGWNGQPAIIQWPKEHVNRMNIKSSKKNNRNLKEVIYGALDGKVYFIDLEDGTYTRNPIQIPGPIKGSVTVDTRGIPLLYVGQGINKVNGRWVKTGYRIFNLIDQTKLFFINGIDTFAYRGWPAFDSTALIDKDTDTLLICGENGLFYRVKLNTQYDENILSIEPEIMKYRYRIAGNRYQGIENSVAVYKNLAFFADNGGWLQCLDINTFEPIWIRKVTDDTDSTIVLEEEQDIVALYTACEVDKQGSIGYSYVRKIDALSGKLIWEKKYKCHSIIGNHPNNGGVLATPVVGKGNIKDIIVFNIARYGGLNNGVLVALNKDSGEEVWRINLKNYSWSSPVAIYTDKGEGYIVFCDSAGYMYLINGKEGEILHKIDLGANVEGSPAVFENMIVVGTRGQKIYGIRIN